MIPMKTPPNMLRPASAVAVRGCLDGLRKLTLQEIGERIAVMESDAKALVLLHEMDHLIWLKSIWHRMPELVIGIELEHKGEWVPLQGQAARWCLLDRYREIDLDAEVRTWLEEEGAGA